MKKKRRRFAEWGPGMSHDAAGRFARRFLKWAGIGWYRRHEAAPRGWKAFNRDFIAVWNRKGWEYVFTSWKQMLFDERYGIATYESRFSDIPGAEEKLRMLKDAAESGSPSRLELAMAAFPAD